MKSYLFGLLFILFCGVTNQSIASDLGEKLENIILSSFESVDVNKDNYIDKNEWASVLFKKEKKLDFPTINLKVANEITDDHFMILKERFNQLDINNDGKISQKEYFVFSLKRLYLD